MSHAGRFVSVIAGVSLLAGTMAAQLFEGGDVIAVGSRISRYDPATGFTLIPGTPQITGLRGATAARNRDIVYVSGADVLRLSPDGTVVTIAAGLGSDLGAIAADRDGSFVVLDVGAGALLRVTAQGVVSTVASGLGTLGGLAVTADGDYVVTDFQSQSVLRLDRQSGAPTLLGSGVGHPTAVAMAANGDAFVVSPSAPELFVRVSPSVGTMTSVPFGFLCTPFEVTSDFDGGLLLGQGEPELGYYAYKIDDAGNIVWWTWLSSRAFLFRIPTLSGPDAGATGPGASFLLDMEIPNSAGLTYAVGAALAVYPGIELPSGDPRATALQPDPLLLATIARGFPPLSTGWSGVLDGQGRATARVDVSLLPPGALAGVVLHVQGMTLDSLAPSGIADLTNIVSLRF